MTTLKLFSLFIGFLAISGGSTQSNNRTTSKVVSKEEANKQIVLDFYQKLFIEKNVDVIDKYVDAGPENFIQHNAWLPDGREPLKEAAPKWFAAGPWKSEIIRVAAEGDLVFIHVKTISKLLTDALGGKATAVVDIFRLDNGKIKEHWDVIQALPDKASNDHPLF